MAYETPELPYDYDALEPVMTADTLHTHHDKHHTAYTKKLNGVLEGHELHEKSPQWLIENLQQVPENIRQKVTNFVGGHVNHDFFWHCMKKNVPAEGEVVDKIVEQWGSLEKFKEEFTNAASTLFGSGWTWLVKDKNGNLAIVNTQNQDSPVSDGLVPLLTLDVWEHAYYIQYRQDRPGFIGDWWSIVNWEFVNEQFVN